MGVNALRANLGTGRDEARKFYDAYFATYTRLAEYLEGIKKSAAEKGYTETLMGRRRYMSGLRSPLPHIRAQAERMAINAPIQGTASDLIKMAMIDVYDKVCESGANPHVKMVLQVHDSLMFEIDEDKVANIAPKIVEIMTHRLTKEESRGVPLEVHAEYGAHWGALKPL
jgi:DNA polymerase-1